ncbi:MAG: hypothetical protein ABIF10_00985 [Candidatus Woesearchaeota archaeon]
MYVSTSCLRGKNSLFEPDVFKVLLAYDKLGIDSVELGSVHRPARNILRLRSFGFNYIVHCVFPPRKKPLMMNFGVDCHIREESIDTASMP